MRRAEHVEAVREVIREAGGNQQVIAKIESREGVRNLDEILQVADGIMVARGDMGVELPSEEVPLVQKQLIEKCNRVGKPVITATQMLDSMVRNPRPTRGRSDRRRQCDLRRHRRSDALCRDGGGQYPIEAVRMMDRIAQEERGGSDYASFLDRQRRLGGRSVADAIARATCETAVGP